MIKCSRLNLYFGKGATAYEFQIGKYYGGYVFLKGGHWRWFFQPSRFYFRKEKK